MSSRMTSGGASPGQDDDGGEEEEGKIMMMILMLILMVILMMRRRDPYQAWRHIPQPACTSPTSTPGHDDESSTRRLR